MFVTDAGLHKQLSSSLFLIYIAKPSKPSFKIQSRLLSGHSALTYYIIDNIQAIKSNEMNC